MGAQAGKASYSLPLEDRVRRVSLQDLNAVTPDDIEAVQRELTRDNVIAAARLLLEENKFADAVAYSRPQTWHAASLRVTGDHLTVMASLLQEKWSVLYSVIPYVSSGFLTMMEEYYRGP